ncbi:MAG: hypothetical protein LBF34_03895 [Puniceicoccales bacterium]|nr:hypothetical protein [Puniceicoccales bacterium]
MQYKGWICGGMLYGMGVFSLCGSTGSQAMEEDDEPQATEANAEAEANEDPIAAKIDCIINAMRYGRIEEALQLIAVIEDRDINRRGRSWGITLLGAAVLWGHMNVAKVLLERGANLHMPCFDSDVEDCAPRDQIYKNSTPFGMAIIDKNKGMIKLLVERGADVNALILGCTSLQVFFGNYFHLDEDGYFWPAGRDGPLRLDHDYLHLDDNGHVGIHAKYFGVYNDCLPLLPPGDNYLLLDNEGLKILNDCCSKNILEVMRLFIENGADVNAKNEEGDTILHYLAGSFSRGGPFDFALVDLLFKAGTDPRIANNDGKLPLQELELPDYVAERFPERREIFSKLVDRFQQRTDELNALENKRSGVSFIEERIRHTMQSGPDVPENIRPKYWQ